MVETAVLMAAEVKTVTIQSPVATPTRSPSKRPIMITQGQKQALIDNLQLEITERARKLRAQYALQAQSLRTRVELRVNRIPTALRKASMDELYSKYRESISQASEPQPTHSAKAPKHPTSPIKPTILSPFKPSNPASSPQRGTKRPSDHFSADDDKENTPDPTHPLSSKKRHKPNNAHPSNPSTVLSPKSSNARTQQHQGPGRPQLGSPQKSYITHPTSPLKPSGGYPAPPKQTSPAKAAAVLATATAAASSANAVTEKPRATRTRAAAAKPAKAPQKAKPAPITRPKRGAEPTATVARNESRTVSAASNTSTGTTVVRKVAKGVEARAAVGVKGKGKEAGGKG
ncbi:MAG: hypothetical protein L6R39_005287, partial [Caloplaca ligustica]